MLKEKTTSAQCFRDKKKFMKNNTKSPLKDRPLRMAGQSLDEEIHNILDDQVLSYLAVPIFLIGFTIYNWLVWYQLIRLPNPILFSVVAIGISVYCFFSDDEGNKAAQGT